MKDILGEALTDYLNGTAKHRLWINNRYGPREEMPLATYFRNEDDMPDLEWLALEQCRGTVLDIGAGAGSHALLLQEWGKDVTAMDISRLAVYVMQQRGVKNAVEADIFRFNGNRFDTLLMLMNGIGLAGNLEQLHSLLEHLKTLINPGGQLLLDSSDISYLYEGHLPPDYYYGQIWYQYEYKARQTDWFQWLYADEHTLQQAATKAGWKTAILMEDEYGQYLARLTL